MDKKGACTVSRQILYLAKAPNKATPSFFEGIRLASQIAGLCKYWLRSAPWIQGLPSKGRDNKNALEKLFQESEKDEECNLENGFLQTRKNLHFGCRFIFL